MDAIWREAITAIRHCLTGCAIGEVLGMVIATAAGWGNLASIALAADTVSILVMEIVDNGVLLVWPSAMEAGLADALFWGSLAFSLAIAFVVTVPVNRAMITRGLGHASAHAAHSEHAGHSGHAEHHEP